MTDALDHIYEDVDRELQERNVSPTERDRVAEVVWWAVENYKRLTDQGIGQPLADPALTAREIVADVCDYGVLGSLFGKSGIEDIDIKGGRLRYFTRGRWKVPVEPTNERRNRHVITQLLARAGVALDQTHPTVDGVQVLDGRGRLAGSIPPASTQLSMSLRLYVERSAALEDLVPGGSIGGSVLSESTAMLSGPAAELLSLDLRAKGGLIVSGEAGSGKTTLLSALLSRVDPSHVVRLVEEFREIHFVHDLGDSYQMVPGADDGQQCRTIAGLVRLMLRMRPDLVAVGEVRGPEAWDLARAAGVGAGFICTIHAPSAGRGLEALALLGRGHENRPAPELIRETFSQVIHFVAHCERGEGPDGGYVHQVTEIRAVVPPMDASRSFSSEVIFDRPDGLGTPMRWTKIMPPEPVVERLERVLPDGSNLRDVLEGRA